MLKLHMNSLSIKILSKYDRKKQRRDIIHIYILKTSDEVCNAPKN